MLFHCLNIGLCFFRCMNNIWCLKILIYSNAFELKMQIQCKIRFIICPFSDNTEKYYISSPVSSPVSFLTQMPSVLMNLHLLRGQKPLNRKFPTSSPEMLCDRSPANLCCIYPSTHKMMRNIVDAEPKFIGPLGSLFSKISHPHWHSSFISPVINIYYFPSSLCAAWQCSTALGLLAVEPGVTKGNIKRFHFQLALTMHLTGIAASQQEVKEFFLSAPQTWLQESRFPLTFCFLVSLAAGRCFWRDGGWKWSEISGSSFEQQCCGCWSHPEAEEYPVQHGHTLLPGQLWEHLQLQAAHMSPHCPFRLATAPWNFAWGTQRDLLVQFFMAPGNFWHGCCEVQNEQCPSAKSWECKAGQPSAQCHE